MSVGLATGVGERMGTVGHGVGDNPPMIVGSSVGAAAGADPTVGPTVADDDCAGDTGGVGAVEGSDEPQPAKSAASTAIRNVRPAKPATIWRLYARRRSTVHQVPANSNHCGVNQVGGAQSRVRSRSWQPVVRR